MTFVNIIHKTVDESNDKASHIRLSSSTLLQHLDGSLYPASINAEKYRRTSLDGSFEEQCSHVGGQANSMHENWLDESGAGTCLPASSKITHFDDWMDDFSTSKEAIKEVSFAARDINHKFSSTQHSWQERFVTYASRAAGEDCKSIK